MSIGLITGFGLTQASGAAPETAPMIASVPSQTSTVTSDQRGWRFTVGGSDVTAYSARIMMSSTATGEETVRIWRVSDEALIGSVAVIPAGTAAVWSDAVDFSSPITLVSGADYIVTTYRTGGGSRGTYFAAKTGYTYNAAITAVGSYSAAGETYPAVFNLANLTGLPDLLIA